MEFKFNLQFWLPQNNQSKITGIKQLLCCKLFFRFAFQHTTLLLHLYKDLNLVPRRLWQTHLCWFIYFVFQSNYIYHPIEKPFLFLRLMNPQFFQAPE